MARVIQIINSAAPEKLIKTLIREDVDSALGVNRALDLEEAGSYHRLAMARANIE